MAKSKEPTYEEFLKATNYLAKQRELISVNNIKNHLGGGSHGGITAFMLERESGRAAKEELQGGGLSEKLTLAIAEDKQSAVKIATAELEEENCRLRQENLLLREQLEHEKKSRGQEQKTFLEERTSWRNEQSQIQKTLETTNELNRILTQAHISSKQQDPSTALLKLIESALNQIASAKTNKSQDSQKNTMQAPSAPFFTKRPSQNIGRPNRSKSRKRRRKKTPRK